MSKPIVSLLLDSGAYSAYTKGQPIDIDKYADFAIEAIPHTKAAINLDVIGIADEKEGGIRSLENFLYLRDKRKLETMPVFHVGEPLELLHQLIKESKYIGLSGSNVSLQNSWVWYDSIWPHITDNEGFPITDFHAFGDGTTKSLLTYPWYSADSTTWFIAAGLAGRCFIDGKYAQFRVRMSKDFTTVEATDTGIKREVWEACFVRNGLDPDICINAKMRESDIMLTRVYMNACFFLELQEKSLLCDRFNGAGSLLIEKRYPTGGKKKTQPANFHFVITSSTATRALAVLSQLKVKNILMSYFYVDPKQWDSLIIPWLYDPIGTCKTHPGLRKQCEILSRVLLNPIVV